MAQNIYCNPADVINLFPMDAAQSAPTLRLAIQMASAYVENYTQRLLLSATYTHEQMPLIIDRQNQVVGRVRQWPITAVNAMSILPQGYKNNVNQEWVLDVGYVDFMTPPDRLIYYTGTYLPPTFQGVTYNGWIRKGTRGILFASYTAGFPTVPEDVKTAAILLTQYFLMRQANAMGAMSISVSAPSSSNSISFGRRSTFLDDADQLLNAYVRRE